jgi:hypothetical protein
MTLPESHRPLRRLSQLTGEEQVPSVLREAKPRCSISAKALTRNFIKWLRLGAAATLLLGLSPLASASLGGTFNSVDTDRAHMNARVQVMQHDAFVIHQISAPQGTVVNEYVSPEGKVFAVSWHGQFPPSMEQILGTYFQQYVAALKAQAELNQAQGRVYGHQPLNLQLPGLVVQTSGHVGAYAGRAYIPNMLPQAMIVSQIQ